MLIYLVSLPIWNFLLPTYAFWKFDDFSWGDTRKTAGEKTKKKAGIEYEGEFDSSKITMKRWKEFEKERILRSNSSWVNSNASLVDWGGLRLGLCGLCIQCWLSVHSFACISWVGSWIGISRREIQDDRDEKDGVLFSLTLVVLCLLAARCNASL
ncbi:hypothetical protein EYC84_006445 [Monilinia fructicola]|uniref:Uncharacterized protein n=1 Tax=Monilinia fructicola TaxID=38448 RepID=A0A5M9K643_MONFR|nr:hypothetical protein EYC84_006445 [Monilinia fructicola]